VFLQETIDSARENAGYPLEIIVVDDGSKDPDCYHVINTAMGHRLISRAIFQPAGNNQGVGESVRVGFGAAVGDVLIKADQDLLYQPGWLRKAIDILELGLVEKNDGIHRVGCLGLFHYPVPDDRFQILSQHDGWCEVSDFCGSAFLIPRDVYEECGPIPTHSAAFAEDIELKQRIQAAGYLLALPNEDLVTNRGFGIGPSTVALALDEETGASTVQSIHESPIIFGQ
jgi:glycosyltransferase involved in cell wall biosynthesis